MSVNVITTGGCYKNCLSVCLFQDPAIATSKRVGDAPYGSYDRGNEKNAWVFDSDGKTPLLGEVSPGGGGKRTLTLTLRHSYNTAHCRRL